MASTQANASHQVRFILLRFCGTCTTSSRVTASVTFQGTPALSCHFAHKVTLRRRGSPSTEAFATGRKYPSAHQTKNRLRVCTTSRLPGRHPLAHISSVDGPVRCLTAARPARHTNMCSISIFIGPRLLALVAKSRPIVRHSPWQSLTKATQTIAKPTTSATRRVRYSPLVIVGTLSVSSCFVDPMESNMLVTPQEPGETRACFSILSVPVSQQVSRQ